MCISGWILRGFPFNSNSDVSNWFINLKSAMAGLKKRKMGGNISKKTYLTTYQG